MTAAARLDPDLEQRRAIRRWLIIGTVIDVLLLPLAAFWGVMSVMASDAGATPAVERFIYVSITLPVAMVVAPIAAWIAYALKRNRLALALLLVPAAWAVASFCLMFALS